MEEASDVRRVLRPNGCALGRGGKQLSKVIVRLGRQQRCAFFWSFGSKVGLSHLVSKSTVLQCGTKRHAFLDFAPVQHFSNLFISVFLHLSDAEKN